MIILSTVATGYWGAQNLNEADSVRTALARRFQQLSQSERHSDHADLVSALRDISENIAQSIIADSSVRVAVQRLGLLHELQVVFQRAQAAGRTSFSLPSLDDVVKLQEKGGNLGYLTLLELGKGFVAEEYQYKQKLNSDIEKFEERLNELERSTNWLYFIALVSQVTGLVLLLLKEVGPEASSERSVGTEAPR